MKTIISILAICSLGFTSPALLPESDTYMDYETRIISKSKPLMESTVAELVKTLNIPEEIGYTVKYQVQYRTMPAISLEEWHAYVFTAIHLNGPTKAGPYISSKFLYYNILGNPVLSVNPANPYGLVRDGC